MMVPFNLRVDIVGCGNKNSLSDELSFAEQWAAPTYSNAPRLGSLPMPKFPLRPKRIF